MAIGLMEVHLVKAKGLNSTCFFGGMEDPYVLIQYEGQEKRSNVAKSRGRNHVWDEKFVFKVEKHGSSDKHKLIFKIMDKDTFSADDFIGQAIIYVKDLLGESVQNGVAKLPPLKYRVVRADQSYRGEIDVAITFTPKVEDGFIEEDIGGWKQSSYYLS
ncbi:16 kDa phloem protein 1-like [Cicer arietinum]|uniref:Elicitor-responsive protein 1-like n=1 Tax=Cicer arietinum TaxID=3827 RepID=A0A1S2XN86_CICAR|nr:elicitor-responsive protein 1-like [Cicer arietinum]